MRRNIKPGEVRNVSFAGNARVGTILRRNRKGAVAYFDVRIDGVTFALLPTEIGAIVEGEAEHTDPSDALSAHKPVPGPEQPLEDAIVERLSRARFQVLKLGRQNVGRVVNDPGAPDLLVTQERWPMGCSLEMEVKPADGRPSSDEQAARIAFGRVVVARNPDDALRFARAFDQWIRLAGTWTALLTPAE